MRLALWPETGPREHLEEIAAYFGGAGREPLAVLVAERSRSRLVGMAELSIRAYAEGCRSDRVAYLEGWFVDPDARRVGVGRALVAAARQWARDQGCIELGSDTEVDNEDGAAAHRALGFEEVQTVRCFRMSLDPGGV